MASAAAIFWLFYVADAVASVQILVVAEALAARCVAALAVVAKASAICFAVARAGAVCWLAGVAKAGTAVILPRVGAWVGAAAVFVLVNFVCAAVCAFCVKAFVGAAS